MGLSAGQIDRTKFSGVSGAAPPPFDDDLRLQFSCRVTTAGSVEKTHLGVDLDVKANDSVEVPV